MDLSNWIERNADFRPDKVAIHFEGAAISYAELDARIKRLAQVLKHQLGIGRGDRVAHIGTNSPELLDLFFACARLGAMLVPLNWRLAPPEPGRRRRPRRPPGRRRTAGGGSGGTRAPGCRA